jgi:hypothetical protein
MIPYRNRPVSTIAMSVLAVFLLEFHPANADVPRPVKERGDDREKEACARVGQIFIIGNTATPDSVILRQVPLYPGRILTRADLRSAERNLARLKIFKADPAPRVRIIDREGDSTYKDIRVDVSERDINLYFWPLMESLEFAAVWAMGGLPPALFLAEGFPREVIDLVRDGKITELPAFLRSKFRNKEEMGCTGYAPPPAVVP